MGWLSVSFAKRAWPVCLHSYKMDIIIKSYKCKLLLKILFALIIFCTLPLLPLYGLILITIRTSVYLCAKIFRHDLIGLVNSASVLLAQEDIWVKPKYNLVVAIAFDGIIHLEELRSAFQQRVVQKLKSKSSAELVYPQLQQYWTSYLNYMFWKQDASFDIKNHVRSFDPTSDSNDRALQLDISQTWNENTVRKIIGGLLAKPWTARRSCWEVLLVDNYKSVELPPGSTSAGSGTLLIFRMHHGMGDGYSILKLAMRDLVGANPDIKVRFPKVTTWDKIQLCLNLPLRMPWNLSEFVVDSIDGTNCWHKDLLRDELSKEYFISISKPIDVNLIKGIKNKWEVSYHAVLCAAVAGGCRRVMEEAGQEVPPEITCLTPMPLANHPDGLTNHLTALYMKWPLSKSYTGSQRLQLISDSINKSKTAVGQLGVRIFTKLTCWTPNFTSCIAAKVPCTVILSNFPGPAVEKQKFLGATYSDIIAAAGCGPGQVGATMMLVSSNGRQRFVTSIDKSVFPSQKLFNNLGGYIEDELLALALEGPQSDFEDEKLKSDANSNSISQCNEMNSRKIK